MKFVSRTREHKLIIRPKKVLWVDVDGQKKPDYDPGLTLKFTRVGSTLDPKDRQAMHMPGMPLSHGRKLARGILDTEKEAKRLKMDEREIIEILNNHHGNKDNGGNDFMRVDDGSEFLPKDRVLVPEGDLLFCTVCQRHTNRRGSNMHLKSKAHQANLQKAEESVRKQVEAM